MTIYKAGERAIAIIEGVLWMRLDPEEVGSGSVKELTVQHKRKYVHKEKGRKTRTKLTPEQIAEMVGSDRTGTKSGVLCKQYGISLPTFLRRVKEYEAKKASGSGQRHEYECANCLHTFKTNLPIGKAMCPDCKSREVHAYQEPEVEEGEV